MSGYKGHLAGGFVAYSLLLFLVSSYYRPTSFLAFEWLLVTLFGALFPDIDIKSKGQNIFYWLCALIFIILCVHQKFTACAFLTVGTIAPQLCRHRGITHRASFLLLLSLGSALFFSILFPGLKSIIQMNFLFFFAGTLSHLYLDFGFKRMLR